MRRGTTPTFVFTVDYDLTGWDVYVTFQQRAGDAREREVTRKPAEVTSTEEGCTVEVDLTQCDTLAFEASRATAQIRAFKDGTALASTMFEFNVGDILMEGTIPREVGR